MLTGNPKPGYSQKYLDIIQASVESDSYNVGTSIMAELIPKQLGFVEYDENGNSISETVEAKFFTGSIMNTFTKIIAT